MTIFVCAVADCKSSNRLHPDKSPWMSTVKGWARFPSCKKDEKRRRLWEKRCRRLEGWKATRNHAICSKHFIEWGENGPSPDYPDPLLFEYNGWGKNCFANKIRRKNTLQLAKSGASLKTESTPKVNKTSSASSETCVKTSQFRGNRNCARLV